MDSCDWSEQRFNEIKEKMTKMITSGDLNQSKFHLFHILDLKVKILLKNPIKCHGIKDGLQILIKILLLKEYSL